MNGSDEKLEIMIAVIKTYSSNSDKLFACRIKKACRGFELR